MTAYILYHSLGKAVPVNPVFPSTQVDGWAVGADLRVGLDVGKYLTIFIRYIMIPIAWKIDGAISILMSSIDLRPKMSENKPVDVGQVWWFWFTTSAFDVDKRLRRLFRKLPHDPRCKFCNAPFKGIGGTLVRAVFGKQQSALNPRYCNLCDVASRKFSGGAEVEMTMLFADIRGSTALSGKMSPTEFSRLIQRFYASATKVIVEADGLVEKLAGDEVAAFWGAGFAGPNYVQRTLEVAQNLSRVMNRQEIPVGIGVHFGTAYFGAMNTAEGLTDISAKGDEVNTAARLASKAAAGEIIVSEQALQAAGLNGNELELRSLELKGISQPVLVRVMRGT